MANGKEVDQYFKHLQSLSVPEIDLDPRDTGAPPEGTMVQGILDGWDEVQRKEAEQVLMPDLVDKLTGQFPNQVTLINKMGSGPYSTDTVIETVKTAEIERLKKEKIQQESRFQNAWNTDVAIQEYKRQEGVVDPAPRHKIDFKRAIEDGVRPV